MDDFEKGETVYITYGDKCNSRFFMNYGFLNEDNMEYDECTFNLCFDFDELGAESKCSMLDFQYSFQTFYIMSTLNNTNVVKLIQFARFVVYESTENNCEELIGLVAKESFTDTVQKEMENASTDCSSEGEGNIS